MWGYACVTTYVCFASLCVYLMCVCVSGSQEKKNTELVVIKLAYSSSIITFYLSCVKVKMQTYSSRETLHTHLPEDLAWNTNTTEQCYAKHTVHFELTSLSWMNMYIVITGKWRQKKSCVCRHLLMKYFTCEIHYVTWYFPSVYTAKQHTTEIKWK